MKKWRAEIVSLEKLEARLNEIEGVKGTILQILPDAHHPLVCRVIWYTTEK